MNTKFKLAFVKMVVVERLVVLMVFIQ